MILNQHRNGSTIGTAATEAEAIRDACSAIRRNIGALTVWFRFARPLWRERVDAAVEWSESM
jgi:hypothetical protein